MTSEAQGRVVVSDVSVSFAKGRRRIEALAKTTLTLPRGSFTSLVGPSGCGKTTLLNVLAGFVEPTTGSASVDGLSVQHPTPDVGVVFQQYGLFPWFTAVGNVEFALKRFAASRAERRAQARQLLDEVGLLQHHDHYPAQLSGGMRQRVALARTLAGRPKVLLMDEPFAALDARTRASMHELLLRIWEQRRTTVLFITHDVDEALLLADTVHVMSAGPGRIVETVPVLRRRPRSVDLLGDEFVALRARILGRLRQEDRPEEVDAD
jgi:NitT/TauT family transport system ATP-binding protein